MIKFHCDTWQFWQKCKRDEAMW